MKKGIAFTLALFMVLFLFTTTGCGAKKVTNESEDTASDASAVSSSSADNSNSTAPGLADASSGTDGTNPVSDEGNGNISSMESRIEIPSDESVPSVITGDPITIKLGTIWGASQYNQPVGENAYSDGIAQKAQELKDKYNITLDIEPITTDSMDIIARSIMAGDVPYDIMEITMSKTRSLGMTGALLDLKTVPNLDLSQPAFAMNSAIEENVSFNGKVYGTNFGYQLPTIMGVFVNSTLLQTYNEPNVVDLYENNQWTFDAFRSICKDISRDTNGDNENDIWGVISTGNIQGMVLTSNAGGTVTRDSGGNYSVAMTSDKGIAAYEWLRNLYITDKSYKRVTSSITDMYSNFNNGQAAFMPGYLAWYVSFSNESDFQLDFVPFPIGTDQTNYMNGVYDARYFVIPKTETKADAVGYVLSQLSAIDMSSIQREQLLKGGITEESVNNCMTFSKYLTPEFIDGVDTSDFEAKMTNALYSLNGSPTTVLKSVATEFQTAVDDFYASVK